MKFLKNNFRKSIFIFSLFGKNLNSLQTIPAVIQFSLVIIFFSFAVNLDLNLHRIYTF